MTGWATRPLGELCDVLDYMRKPITKRDRTDGEYPYYGATGIVDFVGDYIFDEKIVLVGEDGAKWASGERTAFIVSGKSWVNNHAHVLRPKRQIIVDEWLAYYLTHIDLAPFVGGLTVPKLNQGNLREIPIPVAPLDEQKRIVAILDEAFAGIAKATANAERNRVNARELRAAVLDAIVAEESGTWNVCQLDAIAEFKNGLNFTRTSRGDTLTIVGVKDFQDHYWIPTEGLETVTIDGSLAQSYELREGDILTVRSNGNKQLIGRSIVSGKVTARTSHSGFTIRVRVIDSRVSPYFLAWTMKSRRVRTQLVASGGGANISSLNQRALSNLKIAFPDMATQLEIVRRIELATGAAHQLADNACAKILMIDQLKQSLLHKAFTGQLTSADTLAA